MQLLSQVLADLRGGKVDEAVTARLAKLLTAVDDTGQGGSITLTLAIKPQAAEEGAYDITPTVSVKAPEKPLVKAVMFNDGNGGLVREPPKGGEMFSADEREARRDDPSAQQADGRRLRAV